MGPDSGRVATNALDILSRSFGSFQRTIVNFEPWQEVRSTGWVSAFFAGNIGRGIPLAEWWVLPIESWGNFWMCWAFRWKSPRNLSSYFIWLRNSCYVIESWNNFCSKKRDWITYSILHISIWFGARILYILNRSSQNHYLSWVWDLWPNNRTVILGLQTVILAIEEYSDIILERNYHKCELL